MPGNGLGTFRVGDPAALLHVGRIGGDHLKPAPPQKSRCFLDVSLQDPDLFFQAVEADGADCHFLHIRLDLQPDDLFSRWDLLLSHQPSVKKQRDDPRSGAQVRDPVPFPVLLRFPDKSA